MYTKQTERIFSLQESVAMALELLILRGIARYG